MKIDSEQIQKAWKKTWNFLVHDQSIWSYIADAVIIIVLGKFVILPILGLILGTSMPAVSVITSSMDHSGESFEDWWKENSEWYLENNISKSEFESFDFKNGFSRGSALILVGEEFDNLEIGDVIVFSSPNGPIIHRIVSEEPIATKGDANFGQLSFEKEIPESRIQGKAVAWIPLIGWPKVALLYVMSLL